MSRGNSKKRKLPAETKRSHIVSRGAKGERHKCEHKCNQTLIIAILLKLGLKYRDFPGGAEVKDSVLSLQGAQLWSLVREGRSHMPCGIATHTQKQGTKHN